MAWCTVSLPWRRSWRWGVVMMSGMSLTRISLSSNESKDKGNQGEKGTKTQQITTTNKIKSLIVQRDSGDIVVAIEDLMKESFTSSVADSIEKSYEVAHEVAKTLVLDVLEDSSNIQHVGTILSHIFVDETVLSSTRALTYFYLQTNDSMKNIFWQLHWLRFYYCRGGGKVSFLSPSHCHSP